MDHKRHSDTKGSTTSMRIGPTIARCVTQIDVSDQVADLALFGLARRSTGSRSPAQALRTAGDLPNEFATLHLRMGKVRPSRSPSCYLLITRSRAAAVNRSRWAPPTFLKQVDHVSGSSAWMPALAQLKQIGAHSIPVVPKG